MSAKTRDVKDILWERCGGFAECCGKPIQRNAFELAHRRHDGMGGAGPENVSAVNSWASCPGPNGCNQRAEGDVSLRRSLISRGLIVYRWENPSETPAKLHGRQGLVLLGEDGSVTPYRSEETA